MTTKKFLIVVQWKKDIGTEKYAFALPMTASHLMEELRTARENSIECTLVSVDADFFEEKQERSEYYNYNLTDHVLAGNYSFIRKFEEIENPTEQDLNNLLAQAN